MQNMKGATRMRDIHKLCFIVILFILIDPLRKLCRRSSCATSQCWRGTASCACRSP